MSICAWLRAFNSVSIPLSSQSLQSLVCTLFNARNRRFRGISLAMCINTAKSDNAPKTKAEIEECAAPLISAYICLRAVGPCCDCTILCALRPAYPHITLCMSHALLPTVLLGHSLLRGVLLLHALVSYPCRTLLCRPRQPRATATLTHIKIEDPRPTEWTRGLRYKLMVGSLCVSNLHSLLI